MHVLNMAKRNCAWERKLDFGDRNSLGDGELMS